MLIFIPLRVTLVRAPAQGEERASERMESEERDGRRKIEARVRRAAHAGEEGGGKDVGVCGQHCQGTRSLDAPPPKVQGSLMSCSPQRESQEQRLERKFGASKRQRPSDTP